VTEHDETRDEPHDEHEEREEQRRGRRRRLHTEEDVFTMPLPPPPFPGPHRGKVIFYRDEGGEPGKEHEDIMLRKVPTAIAMQFRAAAGGRSLTHAQYLAALVGLHEAMRALADGGDEKIAAELERLGLTSVTV
jgi:hypothetical protein